MAAGAQPVAEADTSDTHTQSSMNVARWLIAAHLPFTVLTRRNLAQLGRYRLLVLSNVHHMDAEEVAAVRAFVRAGGALYASGGTSLVDTQGRKQADFLLADVFGVSLEKANWARRDHYLAPTAAGQPHFGEWTREHPPFFGGYGFEVRARDGADVLATTTLPWPAPDARSFSSIHSNPPWTPTKNPEVVLHRFGKGARGVRGERVGKPESLKETFLRLLRSLGTAFTLEADAPAVVEATLFHQPERARYVVSLVNFQKDLPNIPVDGIRLRLRVAQRIWVFRGVVRWRRRPAASGRRWSGQLYGAASGDAGHVRRKNGVNPQFPRAALSALDHDYFGMGSMMTALSGNDASPALPLIRYWTFNCFAVPGNGSPKLVLKFGDGKVIRATSRTSPWSASVTSFCVVPRRIPL